MNNSCMNKNEFWNNGSGKTVETVVDTIVQQQQRSTAVETIVQQQVSKTVVETIIQINVLFNLCNAYITEFNKTVNSKSLW